MKFGSSLMALAAALLAAGCSSGANPGAQYAGRALTFSCSGSEGSYLVGASVDVRNDSGKEVGNVRLEIGLWAYSDEVIGMQGGEPLYRPIKIGHETAESGWLGVGDVWRASVLATLAERPSVASVSFCSFDF